MDGAQAATRGGARRRRPLRPRSRRFSSRSRRLPNRTPSRRREAWRNRRGGDHDRWGIGAGGCRPGPRRPAGCRQRRLPRAGASPAWRTACPPSKAARCRGLWAPSTWRRAVVTAWRRRRACSRPPASAWSCSSVPTEPPRAISGRVGDDGRRPRPAAHGPGWGQRGRQTQRRQQLSVDVVPGLTVETSRALSWSGREDDDRPASPGPRPRCT